MSFQRSLPLLLLFLVGCSQAPPVANPQRAKAALQTALDAWQKGQAPESLQARTPAIYFNDFGWDPSKQLVDYQIEAEQANGMGWRCEVRLTVKNGSGEPQQQRASYVIDTDPALVVVREP